MESSDTKMPHNYTENKETSLSIIASVYTSDEDVDENESDEIDKTKNQSSDKIDETEIKSSDKIDETKNKSTASINQTHILQQYRTVVLSSSEDTDSEDDSTSSSSSCSSKNSSDSNDSSESDLDTITKTKQMSSKKKDDEANKTDKIRRIRTEFDELPPIEDLQISVSEDTCVLFGEIDKIVEQLVVVKPLPSKPTLNLETVLFLDKGQRALGKIFDVFGSVSEPNYCIRFNDFEHIKQNEIKEGLLVYYCPDTEYTLLVFLHEMTKVKACDAVGDDEPPEFSDDEEELAYYQNLNKKNYSADSTTDNSTFYRRQRMPGPSQKSKCAWRSNPWNRNNKFQRLKQPWINSNHFSPIYSDWRHGYAYQDNAYWPLSQHFSSRLHSHDMSQYYQGQSNFQTSNRYQYPRVDTSSRFSPYFLNHSQSSNAISSWSAAPISMQSPMSTHTITSSSSSSVISSTFSVLPSSPSSSSPPPPPPGV